jgi:hypothetical protein
MFDELTGFPSGKDKCVGILENDWNYFYDNNNRTCFNKLEDIMIELFNIIFVESPTGLSIILAFGLVSIIYTLLTDGIK